MAEKRKLICETCGTDDVHILAWVDANTKEYTSEYHDDSAYCNYCEQETTLSLIIEDDNGAIDPLPKEGLEVPLTRGIDFKIDQ